MRRRTRRLVVWLAVSVAACSPPPAAPTPGEPQPSEGLLSLQIVGTVVIDGTRVLPVLGLDATRQLSLRADRPDTASTDVTLLATWQSSNPAVVLVSPTGLIRSVDPGTAVITAAYNGASTSVSVTSRACVSWTLDVVSEIWLGQTVSAAADGYDLCGLHWSGAPITLESSDPGVAKVGLPGPKVTGVAAGTVILRATVPPGNRQYFPFESIKTLRVLPDPMPAPDRIEVYAESVATGLQVQGTARGYWRNATEDVTSRAVWSSSDERIATVHSGLVRGVARGDVIISARMGNTVGTRALFVGGDRDALDLLSSDMRLLTNGVFAVSYTYEWTLVSTQWAQLRLELTDRTTGKILSQTEMLLGRGAGRSTGGYHFTGATPDVTTICGQLRLIPTGGPEPAAADLGCRTIRLP